jgi:hypothetical protein
MNPSNKEILSCWNKDDNRAIRALADFDNNVLFLFESDLLHQVAIKAIVKEYKESGVFYCIEAWDKNGKVRVTETGEGFKVVNGKALYLYLGEKEPSRADMVWLKNKFKFLGKIDEEYFTRVKPKYIDKDVDCEIYKNPSIRELITLDREFRNVHSELLKDRKHSNIETLRFIFTEGGPWWASTSMLLHSEIAKKIDRFAGAEIRAMGWIENGNTLYVDAYKQNDWNKIISDTLTKAGIKYKLEGHNTKTYEEYFCSFDAKPHGYSGRFNGGFTEIFINPSKKELKEITDASGSKSIRYFADLKEQQLYCWKAETVHYLALEELKENGVRLDWYNILKGTAVLENGKLRFAHGGDDAYDQMTFYDRNSLDRSWLYQWFDKKQIDNLLES